MVIAQNNLLLSGLLQRFHRYGEVYVMYVLQYQFGTAIIDWLPSYVHFNISLLYFIMNTKKNNYNQIFFHQSNLSYLS